MPEQGGIRAGAGKRDADAAGSFDDPGRTSTSAISASRDRTSGDSATIPFLNRKPLHASRKIRQEITPPVKNLGSYISFYKATATLLRAYGDIASNLTEAGYSDAEIAALEKETTFYADTRAAIKKHSGEELDIKPYEADMRHLINTYIQADAATPIGTIDQFSLVELIIETGIWPDPMR